VSSENNPSKDSLRTSDQFHDWVESVDLYKVSVVVFELRE
jgi:hypothetical protein